jgi:aspartate/glutamate racemase
MILDGSGILEIPIFNTTEVHSKAGVEFILKN